MNTNLQIIDKIIETFNDGKTTRCIVVAKIDLTEDLVELVLSLPGWRKFINSQTQIYWDSGYNLEVRGIGYVYKHKDDAMNPKLGEHFAITKAQINMFKLAITFQRNLREFIVKNICHDLTFGIIGCTQAKISCIKHINELKKLCL